MGNGHPLAAVVRAPRSRHRVYGPEHVFSIRSAANPVSAAVGTAVLDVIEDERLLENAVTVGGYTLAKLEKLADRHVLIGDVRGAGMFLRGRTRQRPQSEDPRDGAKPNGSSISCAKARRADQPHRAPRQYLEDPPARCRFSTQHADLLVDTLDQVFGVAVNENPSVESAALPRRDAGARAQPPCATGISRSRISRRSRCARMRCVQDRLGGRRARPCCGCIAAAITRTLSSIRSSFGCGALETARHPGSARDSLEARPRL